MHATFLAADGAGEIVGKALVTCDDGDPGLTAIIKASGGRLDSIVRAANGKPVRRYWTD